ncbi:MAG TPA: SURF1 family protein [Methylotenera sp.]|nr:SURF1 family protein [Methylotenera sp.]
MKQMQFRIHRYVFKPSFIGTVLTLVCIPLFINFGLWQYNKAQQKQIVQAAYNQAKFDQALDFPVDILDQKNLNIDDWNYKKVTVTGVYDTKYQLLLDNKVEANRVGYHVITPLKIDQTSEYVLVNRGWILGKDIHTDLPKFETPSGLQTITGQVWVPSKKIFTLEDKTMSQLNNQSWQMVWQNMDMEQYKRQVPFSVSPLMIKLDQTSTAGGFVRNWEVPATRIATNIGYAYQWFGFALATLLIYLYMSVTRVKPE